MNRRQFTASLGTLAGAAAMPIPAVRAATVAAPAVPPSAYVWAQLIVRAQAKASPAMLARQLRLAPEVAQSLFETLISDGVLRAPSVAGIAKAAQPLQTTGHHATTGRAIQTRMGRLLEQTKQAQPLVKDDDPEIGCSDTVTKDAADACPTEPVQTRPQIG